MQSYSDFKTLKVCSKTAFSFFCRPAVTLSYVIGGILAGCTALTYCELTASYPLAGGSFNVRSHVADLEVLLFMLNLRALQYLLVATPAQKMYKMCCLTSKEDSEGLQVF